MNRRSFLRTAGAATLWSTCGGVSRLFGQSRKKPNFVFFLADDLGWTDLGCFGSTFYETPHIDRLARQSMRFTNAYAACPVCSPTRASIMTGKYPARLNTTDYFGAPQPGTVQRHWTKNKPLLPARYTDRLPLEEVTIAEVFKQHDYATFFAGKWHLGPEGFFPEDQGFDVNKGGIERGGPYGGKKYFSPYGNSRLSDGPEGEHLPDRLATETCTFIEAHRGEPFLAYLSFYSVHTPLIARADLQAKYETKARRAEHDGPVWGKEGDRKVRLVQNHAVFAGMVEAMDQAVGQRRAVHLRRPSDEQSAPASGQGLAV
jgi:arylsulfatase A-like enzyme